MAAQKRHLWGANPASASARSLSNSSSTDPSDAASVVNRNPHAPALADVSQCHSIEDNTEVGAQRPVREVNDLNNPPFQQMNGTRSLRRRHTSLYCIQRELKNLGRRINQHLDAMATAEKLQNASIADPMFDPTTSAPDKPTDGDGPACSSSKGDQRLNNSQNQSQGQDQSKGQDRQGHGCESDAEIYATKLQEGDGNLMVVCEPKDAVKTTVYRQVGNNNVMINLKMVSNSFQIINGEGKVMPLESNGEYWLEIKKKGQGSDSDSSSSRSSGSSDYNPDPGSSSASTPTTPATPCPVYRYEGPDTVRLPQEHSFSSSVDGESRISASYVEPRWPLDAFRSRGPEENYDSCSTTLGNGDDDESIYENIQVDEKKGSIMMKIEAPCGGRPLTDFKHLEECEPVQKALGHHKVIDFLKTHAQQEGSCGVEMSVIGWEYERGELYSTVKRENDDKEEGIYSTPGKRLVRNPTLPPRKKFELRHHKSGDMHHSAAEGVVRGGSGDRGGSGSQSGRGGHTEPTENSDDYERPDPNVLTDDKPKKHEPLPKPPVIRENPSKAPKNNLPKPPRLPVSPRQQRKTGQSLNASWYHGNIDGPEVKKLLRGKRGGSFLVRDTNGKHKYTLEFVDCDSTRRLKIWLTNNKYHLERGASTRFKEFDSVEELIEAAMKSGIEVRDSKSETWKVVRITPVEREKTPQLRVNIFT